MAQRKRYILTNIVKLLVRHRPFGNFGLPPLHIYPTQPSFILLTTIRIEQMNLLTLTKTSLRQSYVIVPYDHLTFFHDY